MWKLLVCIPCMSYISGIRVGSKIGDVYQFPPSAEDVLRTGSPVPQDRYFVETGLGWEEG